MHSTAIGSGVAYYTDTFKGRVCPTVKPKNKKVGADLAGGAM